jgi:hypothetical protein
VADDVRGRTYEKSLTRSDLENSEVLQIAMESEEGQAFLRDIPRSALVRGVRWRTKPAPAEGSPQRESSFRHGYLPISRVSEARTGKGRPRAVAELVDEAAFDRLFASQIQDLWQDYNQRALMQIRIAQERGLARILSSVLSARTRKNNHTDRRRRGSVRSRQTSSPVNGFGTLLNLGRDSFVKNYDSTPLVQEVVAEVADVQRGIDLAQEPQHRIEQLLGELYAGGKKVRLMGREVVVEARGERIPLESLSSGEKQMLQLLLECLSAGANPSSLTSQIVSACGLAERQVLRENGQRVCN